MVGDGPEQRRPEIRQAPLHTIVTADVLFVLSPIRSNCDRTTLAAIGTKIRLAQEGELADSAKRDPCLRGRAEVMNGIAAFPDDFNQGAGERHSVGFLVALPADGAFWSNVARTQPDQGSQE